MRIEFERFLAITSVLAAGTVVGVGCTSQDVDTPTRDSGVAGAAGKGSGGSGGSTGGSGGTTAGSAGEAGGGSGGDAGADGSAGSAGADGAAGADGGACLGDAGEEGLCPTLAYYSTRCGDAGAEGDVPAGITLCDYMADFGRDGVGEAMFTCLNAITDEPCTQEHFTAAKQCVFDVFPQACQAGPITGEDGGMYDCTAFANSCPGEDGGDGLSVEQCDNALNAFTGPARRAIFDCFYGGPVGADCLVDFENCVFGLTP